MCVEFCGLQFCFLSLAMLTTAGKGRHIDVSSYTTVLECFSVGRRNTNHCNHAVTSQSWNNTMVRKQRGRHRRDTCKYNSPHPHTHLYSKIDQYRMCVWHKPYFQSDFKCIIMGVNPHSQHCRPLYKLQLATHSSTTAQSTQHTLPSS